MAHMIDMTKRQAGAFVYRGEKAWHGLGVPILSEDTLEDMIIKAGADFEIKRAKVFYNREVIGLNGQPKEATEQCDDDYVLYRSDTGSKLNIVTGRYKPVQPRQIIEFFKEPCDKYGYQIETIGVLCGGARYFALVNTHNAVMLPGQDKVAEFICLSTSADGSQATEGFQTSIRVICDNTLQMARHSNVLSFKTRHSTEWNPRDAQIKLQITSQAWKEFTENARMLAETSVKKSDQVKLLLNAYYGLDTDEKIAAHKEADKEGKVDKFITRLAQCFAAAPGADLASARGTLWGVVNAVTFDIDHQGTGRTAESRFISSQWGKGSNTKQRVWDACLELAKAA